MNNPEKLSLGKKLSTSVTLVVLLSLCLCVTSFALIYSIVTVEDNIFVTGFVEINLNDGQPVIEEDEFLFEPGMTVWKEFFIRNQSSCDVYYRIYFRNVSGYLKDILQVEIKDGDETLFQGTPSELSRAKVKAAKDALTIDETKYLQIYFHFPEEIGNHAQNEFLRFDLAADAVQTKNNVNKDFE